MVLVNPEAVQVDVSYPPNAQALKRVCMRRAFEPSHKLRTLQPTLL